MVSSGARDDCRACPCLGFRRTLSTRPPSCLHTVYTEGIYVIYLASRYIHRPIVPAFKPGKEPPLRCKSPPFGHKSTPPYICKWPPSGHKSTPSYGRKCSPPGRKRPFFTGANDPPPGTNCPPLRTQIPALQVGDLDVKEITVLPDPCPLPETQKKKGLDMKQRLVYAPMSDVGGTPASPHRH
eukprot:1302357-Pyramimonas_sp.AAC.1